MNAPRCRECKSEILWGLQTNGKWLPLNPVPSERGTVVLMGQNARILEAAEARRYVAAGNRLYERHPVACSRRAAPAMKAKARAYLAAAMDALGKKP